MELLISQAAWWLPTLVLALALQLFAKPSPHWSMLAGAFAIFAIYSGIVFWLPSVHGFPVIEGAEYNWTGKVAAIVTTAILLAIALKALPSLTAQDFGLTLEQREGSLRPSVIACAAMVGFVVLLQSLGGDGAAPSAETLAYQAIIPGIDEELMFRGALLGFLAAAFAPFEKRMIWAAIATTLIFTMSHSFVWTPGGATFDPVAFVYVAVLGGLLVFIRLRTGSVVLPILAHNLTNVANQLV